MLYLASITVLWFHYIFYNTVFLLLAKNLCMRTILLLFCSNVFMTFGWYYHLKHTNWPIWQAVLISWGFAFFEYCLQVPANRIGFESGTGVFQLKIIQEVITLI